MDSKGEANGGINGQNGTLGEANDANRGLKVSPFRQNGGMDGRMAELVILRLANEPGITQNALAEELHIPLRSLQRSLKQLKELGIISRVGGNRFGYWEIDPDYLRRIGGGQADE